MNLILRREVCMHGMSAGVWFYIISVQAGKCRCSAPYPGCSRRAHTKKPNSWICPGTVFFLICPLLAWGACVDTTREIQSMHLERILLQIDNGAQVALDVRVADDGTERAAGFQHVCPETIDSTLILFRYPSEVGGRFHMQNVHAPLDIAFFDSEGRVISLQRMETYTQDHRPLYGPQAAFQYALEAPAGFFEGLGITSTNFRMLLQ